MMRENEEDKLMDFLEDRLEPFLLSDLLAYLGEPVTLAAADELADYLVYNQVAYMNPSLAGEEETWITRAGLFTGKPLVITPDRDEIASGVLIPGSRFIPFYNQLVLPHELVCTYQGVVLPRTTIALASDDVYPKYQLFGEEYSPQYLAVDNDENGKLFSGADYDEPAVVSVSAIDMREVYWKNNFRVGDRIVARPVDWAFGEFELAVLPANQQDGARQAVWMKEFTEALLRSFELNGPCATIDEQLASAYFLGGDSLFTPFASSIDEFLRQSSRISFEPYGVETRLWQTGGVIPAQKYWSVSLIVNPRTRFENAIMLLGVPVTDGIFDSYVLDALFRKEEDASRLIHRLLPRVNARVQFCVPIVEKEAARRLKEIGETYNWFADHDRGVLRSRCVDLHSAIADFVLSLQHEGIEPDIIPDQGAVVLGQLLSYSVSTLESVDHPESDAQSDLESLWMSLEGMEDNFYDTREDIREIMPELIKRRFSVIKKKETPDERS